MHQNKRLIFYCLGFLLFILPGCALPSWFRHVPLPTQISLPTPWGPIILDFGKESERRVQAGLDLNTPPHSVGGDPKVAENYRTFTDFSFAFWVPPGYKSFDRGEHFALRPDYSRDLKKHIEESTKKEQETFGHAAVDTTATYALLTSSAIRYTYGDSVTANFGVGSVLNGWRVTDAAMKEMEKIGETKIVLPHRQIMITIVRKQNLFPPRVFFPSPPNLLLWSSRRLDMAFNVDSIYGDAARGFLYTRYRWSFDNVEIATQPSRSVVVEGLRAYFEGEEFLYLVDLFALQGYTNDQDWSPLRQALESFRFVKKGPF